MAEPDPYRCPHCREAFPVPSLAKTHAEGCYLNPATV